MIRSKKVVLFGWSYGTVPTIHLAADSRDDIQDNIFGVILVSPLTSACGMCAWFTSCKDKNKIPPTTPACCDAYLNIQTVEDIEVPVLVMHGKDDAVIPVTHGKAIHDKLSKTCRGVQPVWRDGEGHWSMMMHALEYNPESLIRFIDNLSRGQC